ncbi:MAG: methyltransferase domain-containing protein [Bacteroidota bacterium]|jgi:ubiquinone/menaquinone biosynthesis C-methylase UbiE
MGTHVCPWYIGYFLASPIRRLFQNPEKILSPYLKPGMKILEVGPGMGFFSIPMARLVGETGRIYCVDLQEKMLKSLRRRALKTHLLDRIEMRLCSESSLQIDDLAGVVDFALAFAMVHEVPDQKQLFTEIIQSLKKDGLLLISEPLGHVTKEEFEKTLFIAQSKGVKLIDSPNIKRSHSAVLIKI